MVNSIAWAEPSSTTTLAASLVTDSKINSSRSRTIQNEIAEKSRPGAIGNGSPLMALAQGKLPSRLDLSLPNELEEVNQKVREAIGIALKSALNSKGKISLKDKERVEEAITNLVLLQNQLSNRLYLFTADIRGAEDYLLGFNIFSQNQFTVGLSFELINRLYSISPLRLAQYVFHECVPEKGLITERDDHRAVYNEVQSIIFGQPEVLALKEDLRAFISEKATSADVLPKAAHISLLANETPREGLLFDANNGIASVFGIPAVSSTPMSRTAEESRAIVTKAAQEGKPLTVSVHLRGVDGPGSSLDIQRFYEDLTKAGVKGLSEIPSTPTFASEFTAILIITPAENPEAIEYVAPDYGIAAENPYIVVGPVRGEEPYGQKNSPAYIFRNMYNLKGMRITLESISPMAVAGGMESSAAFNIALLGAASVLSGKNESWSELHRKSFSLDNGIVERGPNGGQGALAAILGGVYRHMWLGGLKGSNGEFLYPGSIFSIPLVREPDISFFEARMMLVQAGKKYIDGKAEVGRTASLINEMWTSLLREKDPVGVELHTKKLSLAAQYTEGIARQDMQAVVNAVNAYVDIRDGLCKRWAQLALDAEEGKDVPAYAHQFLEMLKKDAVLSGYYERHKKGEINLRETSLYSDTAKELIEAGRREGIALMPLGAGGPGANLVAISPNPGTLNDFLNRQGLDEFRSEADIRQVMRAGGENILRGYMPFKISMEPIQFINFEEHGLKLPAQPVKASYNEGRWSKPARTSQTENGLTAEFKTWISEDLPVRAQTFKTNLSQALTEHPDQLFFIGIETGIGESQKAQIMPVYKAIDEIREMRDASGKPLFPNLMLKRASAGELATIVIDLSRQGKLNLNNAFIGARRSSVDNKAYDAIKGEGRAWISGIDDSGSGDYLPVFEAITLNMMAYLNADLSAIKNFYDTISDKPIDPKLLQDMLKNRIIYILPKITAFDTKQLRELYELVRQVYVAA